MNIKDMTLEEFKKIDLETPLSISGKMDGKYNPNYDVTHTINKIYIFADTCTDIDKKLTKHEVVYKYLVEKKGSVYIEIKG